MFEQEISTFVKKLFPGISVVSVSSESGISGSSEITDSSGTKEFSETEDREELLSCSEIEEASLLFSEAEQELKSIT